MQLKLFIMQTAWLRQSRAAFSSVVVANGWSSRSKSLALSAKKVWSIPLGWRLQQVSALAPVSTYTRRLFAASSSAVKPIRLGLRVLQVRAAQSSSANGEECAICFDQLQGAKAQVCTPSSCSHRFCFPCLQAYMRTKMSDIPPQEPTCPLCRAPFDVILKGDGSVFLPEATLLQPLLIRQLDKFVSESLRFVTSVRNGSKSLIDCAWNDVINALQVWKWERHVIDTTRIAKKTERIIGCSLMLIASISLGRFPQDCASCKQNLPQDPQKIMSTSVCWHLFHVDCLLQIFRDTTPRKCPVCNVIVHAVFVLDGATSNEDANNKVTEFMRQYLLSILSLLKVEQERLNAESNAASRDNSNKVLQVITECVNTIEYMIDSNQSPQPFRRSPESLIRKLEALQRTT